MSSLQRLSNSVSSPASVRRFGEKLETGRGMEERVLKEKKRQIEKVFASLSDEVRELSLGTTGDVERVKGPLAPLEFLRNYVLPGRPCIITDALDHWPALQKWSNEYLLSKLRDHIVSVHFTPDGRADALVDPLHMLSAYNCPVLTPHQYMPCVSSPLTEALLCCNTPNTENETRDRCVKQCHLKDEQRVDTSTIAPLLASLSSAPKSQSSTTNEIDLKNANVDHDHADDALITVGLSRPNLIFVKAHVEKLPFSTALELIVDGSGSGEVAYAQEQNGCFLSEYGALAADAEEHIPWATEALGCMPDAVNLWIGNQSAVTSFHKDHYENLYAVVAGAKHFTLMPPVDAHRMYIDFYSCAQYVRMKDRNRFAIVLDDPPTTVPWVGVDPNLADERASKNQFPRYCNGSKPFTCTVQAGEILYLPSMWFHHVRQSPDLEGRTIALNFWYDMQFDMKYAYFNMMQSLLCVGDSM